MRAELLEQRLMAAADAQALQARVDELQGQQQPLRAGEPTDADGASLPPGSAADGVVTRNTDGAALPSAAAAAEVESLPLPLYTPSRTLPLPPPLALTLTLAPNRCREPGAKPNPGASAIPLAPASGLAPDPNRGGEPAAERSLSRAPEAEVVLRLGLGLGIRASVRC